MVQNMLDDRGGIFISINYSITTGYYGFGGFQVLHRHPGMTRRGKGSLPMSDVKDGPDPFASSRQARLPWFHPSTSGRQNRHSENTADGRDTTIRRRNLLHIAFGTVVLLC